MSKKRIQQELERVWFKSAKYKDKKEVKTKDGDKTTVYEYSDRQVNKRHKEKSKKVEKIRQNIDDLEKKIYQDLKSKENKMVALAVALINHTYERVGNDESASNGHYGVTGWKKKHLSFKGGTATLKYTGKSGVRHEKEITNKKLVSALKEISKGLSKEDCLLEEINASDVNEYLDQFGITAKDIRGYHANREMQDRLKAIREENGELPKNRKEKEQQLKEEFKEALEGAASAVGHESATLRKQYLVPHLEETYMKDGTVITTLKKATVVRIASQVFATKSQSEKEEEEIERLQKPSPKKKPPRKDKSRKRMKVEDKDIDKDPDMNTKDMSMNYKIVGSLLESIWFKSSATSTQDAWSTYIENATFTNEKGNNVKFETLQQAEPEKASKIKEKWVESFEEEEDTEDETDYLEDEDTEVEEDTEELQEQFPNVPQEEVEAVNDSILESDEKKQILELESESKKEESPKEEPKKEPKKEPKPTLDNLDSNEILNNINNMDNKTLKELNDQLASQDRETLSDSMKKVQDTLAVKSILNGVDNVSEHITDEQKNLVSFLGDYVDTDSSQIQEAMSSIVSPCEGTTEDERKINSKYKTKQAIQNLMGEKTLDEKIAILQSQELGEDSESYVVALKNLNKQINSPLISKKKKQELQELTDRMFAKAMSDILVSGDYVHRKKKETPTPKSQESGSEKINPIQAVVDSTEQLASFLEENPNTPTEEIESFAQTQQETISLSMDYDKLIESTSDPKEKERLKEKKTKELERIQKMASVRRSLLRSWGKI